MASPLRNRDFGILFAGRAVDALGDAVAPAALTLAVVTATRSSAGLAAVGFGFANPVWLTAVQQEVPAEVLARVSAYDWLVSLGAQLLGFAVGPALTPVAGFTGPLSAAAALVVITLLVPASLPSVRDLRLVIAEFAVSIVV